MYFCFRTIYYSRENSLDIMDYIAKSDKTTFFSNPSQEGLDKIDKETDKAIKSLSPFMRANRFLELIWVIIGVSATSQHMYFLVLLLFTIFSMLSPIISNSYNRIRWNMIFFYSIKIIICSAILYNHFINYN